MSASPLEPRVSALEQAMVELARAQARTEASVERLSQEMREFKDNVDRAISELQQTTRELQRGDERSRRQWGELANRMGTLVEDIVAPGVPAVFQRLYGIAPDLAVRVRRHHPEDHGRVREFDVVASSTEVMLLTETKSTLAPEDVDRLVRVLAEDARAFLPEAQGRRLVGAVASFYVDPSLVRAAERHGLLALGLARGMVEVLNTEGFRPREF